MIFLEWYKKGHPRAAAVTTFESLWKAIRELYYDKAQRKMPDEVGTPVVNVGAYHLCYTLLLTPESICKTNLRRSTR